MDYSELMKILSRPRPSGSAAERDTIQAIQGWLATHGISYRLQPFTLYPWFFICIGLWMIVAQTSLAIAVWLQGGWWTTLMLFPAVLGGLLDTVCDLPLVTWPGRITGQNILIEFNAPNPKHELIISAHYDSKTELFDHHVRTFFILNLPLGIGLAILVGLLSPLEIYLPPVWANTIYIVSIALTVPLLCLAWGLGLNLALGQLRRSPSQGAVDNGAACAILLGLAHRVHQENLLPENTNLTLALFGGEEVNMQGSRAYASQRASKIPLMALNMEIMAQNGDYVYWEKDGTAFKLVPTNATLNQTISNAVTKITGKPALAAPMINSDGYSFLRMGIPATTLGTYDSQLKERGFHLPSDNLSRVKMERLPEGVKILVQFIQSIHGKTG